MISCLDLCYLPRHTYKRSLYGLIFPSPPNTYQRFRLRGPNKKTCHAVAREVPTEAILTAEVLEVGIMVLPWRRASFRLLAHLLPEEVTVVSIATCLPSKVIFGLSQLLITFARLYPGRGGTQYRTTSIKLGFRPATKIFKGQLC